jgi:4-diphosphocytidyl-2-C-methyl-D-erythritol kinase
MPGTALTLPAYAKINLTLEVLRKREDGYHEVRGVMQTIGLADFISFAPADENTFHSASPGWSAEKSLLPRAVSLLQALTGCRKGVSIDIVKNIPLASGLGGDSSDAATVLAGLNHFWGLGRSVVDLLPLAEKLGMDVSFFLYGGTALVAGRGEIVTPLPPLPPAEVLVMVPRTARPDNKTTRLYAGLKPEHFTDGTITGRLVHAVAAGETLDLSRLFNTFENVAFSITPELQAFYGHILKIGAHNVHLCGSGPAMFTVVEDRTSGEELMQRLRSPGLALYLVPTVSG